MQHMRTALNQRHFDTEALEKLRELARRGATAKHNY